MLIQEPPVEVVSGLWMLGTPQYPVYLFKSGHEGTLIEGGIRAIGSVLAQQFEQLVQVRTSSSSWSSRMRTPTT